MKFSAPTALALFAFAAPALAKSIGEVYIESDLRSDRYDPEESVCENTEAPEKKVVGIEIYTKKKDPEISCVFFKDADCKGATWTLETKDSEKIQKFSKPFYVASLKCTQTNEAE
ncbi:hypothetical protein N7471_013592 [Penicillium samsonianum]|uniref:uncharacterized protein n=1 Tax=Penicillium samsonianum TaxID=1882272 RepID=UPI0025465FE8|nr:uncharacterized protein N7471_013592 [Penicillium samsonianum]KAJ6118972.1 hypothetical protein N7471_013592 [Penicillium samsonianum]